MYVSVTDTGYILYDVNEKGITEETGRLKTGQIFIDQYNKQIDKIQMFGARLSDGEIMDHIFFRLPDGKEFYLPSLDFSNDPDHTEKNLPFIDYYETAYVKLNGKITQVFRVEEIMDLFNFDILRIKNSGMKLKNCEDCDKLFFVNRNQVRCEQCRHDGKGEEKKRNNIKNNPFRSYKRNMKDKISKWHKGQNDYQKIYKNDLFNRIDETHDLESLEALDRLHKAFQKLDKIILKDPNKKRISEWERDRFNVWNEKDPEQWLRSWFEKAGLAWE